MVTYKCPEGIYGISKKRSKNSKKIEKEQFPFSLGYIKDESDLRDYQISQVLLTKKFSNPKHIDYTEQMTPVKDQMNLGSCVAFAVASVIEWQQQKEYLNERKSASNYKRKSQYYDLSEQWIYYKSKEIDSWPNQEGTSIRCALKIINKKGVPEEDGWSYSDQIIGKPKFWSYSTAKWNKNKKYYRINNLDELKQSLIDIGPVIIGVTVFKEFFCPDNKGVIKYPSNPKQYYGGHALCCIGFDDDKQLIKIKNSWSENWGNNGYGYLPYNYIEDFMTDAWITVNKNINELY